MRWIDVGTEVDPILVNADAIQAVYPLDIVMDIADSLAIFPMKEITVDVKSVILLSEGRLVWGLVSVRDIQNELLDIARREQMGLE